LLSAGSGLRDDLHDRRVGLGGARGGGVTRRPAVRSSCGLGAADIGIIGVLPAAGWGSEDESKHESSEKSSHGGYDGSAAAVVPCTVVP